VARRAAGGPPKAEPAAGIGEPEDGLLPRMLRQTFNSNTSQQESANASQHHCSLTQAVIQ